MVEVFRLISNFIQCHRRCYIQYYITVTWQTWHAVHSYFTVELFLMATVYFYRSLFMNIIPRTVGYPYIRSYVCTLLVIKMEYIFRSNIETYRFFFGSFITLEQVNDYIMILGYQGEINICTILRYVTWSFVWSYGRPNVPYSVFFPAPRLCAMNPCFFRVNCYLCNKNRHKRSLGYSSLATSLLVSRNVVALWREGQIQIDIADFVELSQNVVCKILRHHRQAGHFRSWKSPELPPLTTRIDDHWQANLCRRIRKIRRRHLCRWWIMHFGINVSRQTVHPSLV